MINLSEPWVLLKALWPLLTGSKRFGEGGGRRELFFEAFSEMFASSPKSCWDW